ncbi:MAG: VOC family protein [Bacteroidota bacterium]|nr:VOC family protein [Bacteroidota bacterium]
MRLTFLRPMLRTDNIKATIDFYTGTLGFILEEYNDEWGWASLHKDDVWIMLARPDEHEEFKGPPSPAVFISRPTMSTGYGIR